MLDFAIKKFYEMDKKILHINNMSETYDGVPACKCYTKSGINNGYIIIATNSAGQMSNRGLSQNTIPKKYETIESLSCIPVPDDEGAVIVPSSYGGIYADCERFIT